jgi:hypothetical protein
MAKKFAADKKQLTQICKFVDKKLKILYGQQTGFFICMAPFELMQQNDSRADYTSNVSRDVALIWLAETCDRLIEHSNHAIVLGAIDTAIDTIRVSGDTTQLIDLLETKLSSLKKVH